MEEALAIPEFGFALTDPKRLARLEGVGSLTAEAVADFLGDPEILEIVAPSTPVTHFYFGGEYCEHLLPAEDELDRALALAERKGLAFCLATPVASDGVIDRLNTLLRRLPEHAEVLANDWGVARLVAERFPGLRPVAGRQLAKMIKDPRLPGTDWSRVYPAGFRGEMHRKILAGLGISRLEMDLPPSAGPGLFAADGLDLCLRAPYAYVAKGRICKIGGLSQPVPLKFSPGGHCQRECLGLIEVEGGKGRAAQRTFQRGTTMFYRYDPSLMAVVRNALAEGGVSRLVVAEV